MVPVCRVRHLRETFQFLTKFCYRSLEENSEIGMEKNLKGGRIFTVLGLS